MSTAGERTERPSGLRTIARVAARAISVVERCWGNDGPQLPPMFIVGLPRAGTTLVYQAICASTNAAYATELTNWLPMCPAMATWMSRPGEIRSTEFKSSYGRSSSLRAPGEGVMWNLWLNKHAHYTTADEISQADARELKRIVGRIERIGRGAFINKNLRHNQRMQLLAELFPQSLFLVVTRSPFDVAVSLLRGRQEQHGDAAKWFSIRPRSIDISPDISPEEAVVLQVKGLLQDLKQDADLIGDGRCRALGYESFCNDPRGAVDGLCAWAQSKGVLLSKVSGPPETFKISSRLDGLSEKSVELVREHIERTTFEKPAQDLNFG